VDNWPGEALLKAIYRRPLHLLSFTFTLLCLHNRQVIVGVLDPEVGINCRPFFTVEYHLMSPTGDRRFGSESDLRL